MMFGEVEMGIQGLTRECRRRRPRPRVTNLWRRVRFTICGIDLVRLLVPEADAEGEISAESSVGKVLLAASVGDRIVVQAPGGDVVVKVLEIC